VESQEGLGVFFLENPWKQLDAKSVKDCKSHYFSRALQHYYSPADWGAVETLCRFSKFSGLDLNLFFFFDLLFSLVDIILGACFCLRGRVYLALGANPRDQFFGL